MGVGESFSMGLGMGGSESGRERAPKGLEDSKGVPERGATKKVLSGGSRDEVEGVDERLNFGGPVSGFFLDTGTVFFFFTVSHYSS